MYKLNHHISYQKISHSLFINSEIINKVLTSAHLLHAETHHPGALHRTDELGLAQGLFYDVTKVFKVLKQNRKGKKMS